MNKFEFLQKIDSLKDCADESRALELYKEAEDIFEDTKKFLYLAAHCKADCFSASIYHQFQIIDEMWHSFLQFTDQYADFCEAYLGGFLHHFPFSRSLLREQMKLLARTQQTFASYKQETFARQLAKTKDLLGDDTLIKWYGEYAHRYNVSQLNALRKQVRAGCSWKLE